MNQIDFAAAGGNDVQIFDNCLTGDVSEADSDDEENTNAWITIETHSARIVADLPFDFFRQKLVEHFDILFQSKKIVWPKSGNIERSS